MVESGETEHGVHAPKRAENPLERVHHAQPRERRWSERRLAVDDGDAEEAGGEERVM